MSYDIRFAVKVAGTEDMYAVIGEPERPSPTYNVGTILRKSTGWDFEQGIWYPVKEVLPMIEKGIHELSFNSEAYKQYEPDNGWGSVDSALKALQSIRDWLADDNDWQRGWNGDIPIEHIYMRW